MQVYIIYYNEGCCWKLWIIRNKNSHQPFSEFYEELKKDNPEYEFEFEETTIF